MIMRILHVIQGHFGVHGWEDLTATYDHREAVVDLIAYRHNDPDHEYRKIKRREKKRGAVMIWRCQGTVTKIRDGDTFLANLDLGWNHWQMAPTTGTGPGVIRVLGLYCPELNEPGGPEAREFARFLLTFDGVHGVTVTLESHSLDSFGRSLAIVTLPDGRNFANAMILEGHGTATATPKEKRS